MISIFGTARGQRGPSCMGCMLCLELDFNFCFAFFEYGRAWRPEPLASWSDPPVQRWKNQPHPQRKVLISGNRYCVPSYADFVDCGGDAQVWLARRPLLFFVSGLTSLSRPSCCVDGMLPTDSWEIVTFYNVYFWETVTFLQCLFLRDCDFVTVSISERLWLFYSVYFWETVILQCLLNRHCNVTVSISETL